MDMQLTRRKRAPWRTRNGRKMLDEVHILNEFVNLFKSQERRIHFKGIDGWERNGEHVFQIVFMAWFAIERFGLELDLLDTLLYALAHDFRETYAGDTPAFLPDGNGSCYTPCRKEKAAREEASMERIRKELNVLFPALIKYMDAYEAQADPESRFVYALDKLIAGVNIAQDGGRTNQMLDVDLRSVDRYQRSRIERNEFVLKLYEAHFKEMLEREPELFPTKGPST